MTRTRACLREKIFLELLARIRQGRLAPGARLRVVDIAREFEVSVAPVREALRELEVRRLVVTRAYAESRVRQLNEAELQDTNWLKHTLESQAVRLGACWGRLEEMRRWLDRMLEAAEVGDRVGYLAMKNEFHRCLVGSAFSAAIVTYWERVVDELGPLPKDRAFDTRQIRVVYGQICDAVATRRPAELRRLLEELPLYFELAKASESSRVAGMWPLPTAQDLDALTKEPKAVQAPAAGGHDGLWRTATKEDLEALARDPPDD